MASRIACGVREPLEIADERPPVPGRLDGLCGLCGLCPHAMLYRIVAAEELEREGPCASGRFVAGDEEDDHFVAHVGVAQGFAGVRVAGVERRAGACASLTP
jgi:hypothetical protein